jgi:hypothetical protein
VASTRSSPASACSRHTLIPYQPEQLPRPARR